MRQRFKAISVSRNIASCFGGNLGWREELTGSLTDLGTASLDVKANQGVAAMPPERKHRVGQFENPGFNHNFALQVFPG